MWNYHYSWIWRSRKAVQFLNDFSIFILCRTWGKNQERSFRVLPSLGKSEHHRVIGVTGTPGRCPELGQCKTQMRLFRALYRWVLKMSKDVDHQNQRSLYSRIILWVNIALWLLTGSRARWIFWIAHSDILNWF